MEDRAELDTPAKRARLKPQKNPYWTSVAGRRGGLSLGYRRATSAPGKTGMWVAKAVLRGRRFEEKLGTADDRGAQEGALTFASAKSAALAWARQRAAQVEREEAEGSVAAAPTIASVCDEYLFARSEMVGVKKRGTSIGHAQRDEAFASIKLAKLTADDIHAWRGRLQLKPATENRVLNDVRAALNAGAYKHFLLVPAKLPEAIKRGTKAVRNATTARKQILDDIQVRKIVGAAFARDADFGRLTLLLAATGARFSQVAALRVRDVQLGEAARIMMPSSRKGGSKKDVIRYRVAIGSDVEAALQPILAHRKPDDVLLMRWEMVQTGPLVWEKKTRVAWKTASNMKTWWPVAVASAAVPGDTIPYSLRHSSIVRAIRGGIPLRMVAAMHDTSTSQIERHYSAFILDVSDELARRAIVRLAPPAVAAE